MTSSIHFSQKLRKKLNDGEILEKYKKPRSCGTHAQSSPKILVLNIFL